tara:strand:+ start:76 stop:273 length:198 start_codon:yes stop_codon:yes gene_type:complete
MKIYITSYTLDGNEYEGPQIRADSWDSARYIAKSNGLTLHGELTDILQDIVDQVLTEDLDNRVLH